MLPKSLKAALQAKPFGVEGVGNGGHLNFSIWIPAQRRQVGTSHDHVSVLGGRAWCGLEAHQREEQRLSQRPRPSRALLHGPELPGRHPTPCEGLGSPVLSNSAVLPGAKNWKE